MSVNKEQSIKRKNGGRADNSTKRKEGAKEFTFRGFVNVNLTEQEKAKFDVWATDDELLAEALRTTVASVGKVSLSYDAFAPCYIASITVQAVGLPDRGLCVTARSADLTKAINRVLYCYWVIADGDLESQYIAKPTQYSDEW